MAQKDGILARGSSSVALNCQIQTLFANELTDIQLISQLYPSFVNKYQSKYTIIVW